MTQYYYEPPRTGASFLERFRPLVEPPLAYVVFFVGLAIAFVLSFRGSRYGYHLLVLLIAFPIHELAHAITADRLGDPTPRLNGRITLNPLAQLNFIGSLLMILVGIGFAYVPINPSYLRPNPRTGHMIVAAVGPISNLILAVICAILWRVALPFLQGLDDPAVAQQISLIFYNFAFFNAALFFFNLVPLAPLDGFFILKGLLPSQLAYHLEGIQRYGFIIFLAVFFIGPFLGLPILEVLIFGPAQAVTGLLFGV